MGMSSPSAISNWELGTSSPDLNRFVALCLELEVPPTKLLGFTDADFGGDNEGRTYSCDLGKEQIEKSLLEAFWALKEDDRKDILSEVHERSSYGGLKDSEIEFPLFIGPEDPSYIRILSESRNLRRLRREKGFSYEDVLAYLVSVSTCYERNITLVQLVRVFRGVLCPSDQLYRRIHDFLSTDKKSKEAGDEKNPDRR